jgi:hypothetical protein
MGRRRFLGWGWNQQKLANGIDGRSVGSYLLTWKAMYNASTLPKLPPPTLDYQGVIMYLVTGFSSYLQVLSQASAIGI